MKLSLGTVLVLLSACASGTEDPGPRPPEPLPQGTQPYAPCIDADAGIEDPIPCSRRDRIVVDGFVFDVPLPCDPTNVTRDLGDPQP